MSAAVDTRQAVPTTARGQREAWLDSVVPTVYGPHADEAYLAVAFGYGGRINPKTGRYRFTGGLVDSYIDWPRGRVALLDELDKLDSLVEHCGERIDYYAVATPRHGVAPDKRNVVGRYRRNDNPTGIATIAADLDGPLLDVDLFERIDPTAVYSGSIADGQPCQHVYVPLSEPVDPVGAQALAKALAFALAGDAGDAKHYNSALLRIPGGLNHKTGNPVLLVRVAGATWDPAALAQLLNVDLAAARQHTASQVKIEAAHVEGDNTPDNLPNAVTRALVLPLPTGPAGRADRSAAVHRLVGACLESGLDLGTTTRVVAGYGPAVDKFHGRIPNEVARSWSALLPEVERRNALVIRWLNELGDAHEAPCAFISKQLADAADDLGTPTGRSELAARVGRVIWSARAQGCPGAQQILTSLGNLALQDTLGDEKTLDEVVFRALGSYAVHSETQKERAAHCTHHPGTLLTVSAEQPPANDEAPAAKKNATKPKKAKRTIIAAEEAASGLPDIVVTGRPLREVFADARDALLSSEITDPRLFVHGDDGLVEIDPITGTLRKVETPRFAVLLSERMNFRERTEDEDGNVKFIHTRVLPSDTVQGLYASAPALGLPTIERTSNIPFFGKTGRLVTRLGFDRETGIYHVRPRGGVTVPEVPKDPNPGDVDAALAVLLGNLLVDFPFVSEGDLAAAIAMPITLMVRAMINGPCPLFAIDAPKEGSGKGLFTEVAIRPLWDGYMVTAAPTKEDEWGKVITSVLEYGHAMVLFDNINAALNSGPLASAVTAYPIVSNRLLGGNVITRQPPPGLWCVTGNNLTASGELARRMVRIRLDARTAKPAERTGFKHEELRDYMEENRGLIVWSWLVLAQSWISAGQPIAKGLPVMGSFEKWTKIVGSILAHIGVTGFLANRAAVAAEIDSEGELIGSFLYTWMHDPGTPKQVDEDGQVIKQARLSCSGRAVRVDELLDLVDEFKVELPEKIGPMGTDRRSAFGKWLRQRVVPAPHGPFSVTTTKPKNKAHYTLHDDGTGPEYDEGGLTIGNPAK